MSTSGEFLFLISGAFAIAGAMATVLARRPLRAAMGLLLHIVSLAGIYLTLHAHLLAALQLLVYAGAIVVLFVFVIMLIGPDSELEAGGMQGLLTRTTAGAIGALVTSGIAFSLIKTTAPYVGVPQCAEGVECGQFGGVEGLGRVIYTDAVVPFELVSILLTVAIVGAIAIARGRSKLEAAEAKLEREAQAKRDADQLAYEQRLSAEVSAHGGH